MASGMTYIAGRSKTSAVAMTPPPRGSRWPPYSMLKGHAGWGCTLAEAKRSWP